MFTGLSAFPLTPLRDDVLDESAYVGLVERLVAAGVDSITALGSTGSYMYLDRAERRRVAELTVRHAGSVPVMVGVGALRTSEVRALTEDAQDAGASAVLVAPVTYQKLTDDEVFGLFEDVNSNVSVPLVVYDNPGTTHVTFTDDLYARIATLPQVASIKIPGVPVDPAAAASRVEAIRRRIPANVTIGVSGDAFGATGLNAGCDAWYSAIGGTLPAAALSITRAALSGRSDEAVRQSARLDPIWALFAEYGSLRVIAAIAEHLGMVGPDSLPRPVRDIPAEARSRITQIVTELDLN